MRWIKKGGHVLSCFILVILCAAAGLLTGCDAESAQILLSLLDTETVYEQAEDTTLRVWEDQADRDTGSGAIETEAAEAGTIETEDPEAGKIETETAEAGKKESEERVSEDGTYTSPEQVALYLHLYGHLPDNYITKKEAEAAGWDSSKGNLWDVADGMSIGGTRFGNYEGELPDQNGRKWYECDVNYEGGYRGAERLVYSNDGLIYYTGDHYETFEQLY